MEKNESYKKKKLDKKDYKGKDNAAKVVKGVGVAAGLAVIIPTVITGIKKLIGHFTSRT